MMIGEFGNNLKIDIHHPEKEEKPCKLKCVHAAAKM